MTTTVPVTVKGSLEARVEHLPPTALDLIKSALSFRNEDKDVAQREEVFGWWDMPDTIDLWRVEARRGGDTVLVMPRGFAAELGKVLAGIGAKVAWTDQRVEHAAELGYYRPCLFDEQHDYQFEAVREMLRSQQGFYECPAGGGKTVTMLGLLAYAQQRAIVIVDKADLVEQWREAAAAWLGLKPSLDGDISEDHPPRGGGKIGQGVWVEEDLTVALRQTLWERIDELDATGWWAQFGVTIYDEGHHLAAETLGEVCKRCVSKWALGTSATPARTATKGKIVHALVGPIIHRTTRAVLRARGILMEPTIEQIATEFETDFWKTHSVGAGEPCEVPGCKKSGRQQHGHRNNYASVVKKLVEDKRRNAQIAAEIVAEPNHIHLVPSRQLKHLDIIEKTLKAAGWEQPIFKLRGEENAKGEARGIVQEIRSGSHQGCVILSTVADEALDIPPIDRVHIVFPMRQAGATIQLLGRSERVSPGKDDCIIKDYVDARMDVLLSQAEEREKVYRRQEFRMTRTVRMKIDEQAEPVKFSGGTFSSFSDQWPFQITHPINGNTINVLTREHLFQAMKTTDEKSFDEIVFAPTANKAKELGNAVQLREDWEEIKFTVMKSIIRDQCDQHEQLYAYLLGTGRRAIIEARPDPVWGEGPDGRGMNLLGKAWMEVREDIRLAATEAAIAVGSGR